MRFALFRRREAFRVTKLAAVPLHGLETDSDGVMLHVGDAQGQQRFVELPRAIAEELRDYLTRATATLDHWTMQRKRASQVRVHETYRTKEAPIGDASEVAFSRGWDIPINWR